MLKEATYKEKFQILQNFLPEMMETVKKDLKNEHLKKDWMFAKKYFPGKNLNKISNLELKEGYELALSQEEKGEEIAEFISNCWLLKNSDLYHYFEKKLTEINHQFDQIEQLEPAKSKEISEEAATLFGAYKTYLFSVLNSVAFQEKDLDKLKNLAEKQSKENEEQELELAANQSVDEIHKFYDLKIARLSDKYEKKIAGLQRKYFIDVEGLKKQISKLMKEKK